jgi:hypothetical protein
MLPKVAAFFTDAPLYVGLHGDDASEIKTPGYERQKCQFASQVDGGALTITNDSNLTWRPAQKAWGKIGAVCLHTQAKGGDGVWIADMTKPLIIGEDVQATLGKGAIVITIK